MNPADALAASLSTLFRCPITVTWTDARSTLLRFTRRRDGSSHLRLHHSLATVPEEAAPLIAAYLTRHDKNAARRLKALAARTLDGDRLIRRPQALHPKGRTYDLQALFEDLNQRYFQGEIQARITWGRAWANGPIRFLRLGSYHHPQRLIRIHPRLDDPAVPQVVLEYLIYHEMLHQLHQGGHRPHPTSFRLFEQQYEHIQEAKAWLKANKTRLFDGCDRER